MLFSQRVFQNIKLPLKERQIDAGIAGRLDIEALGIGPVFIVANR